MSQTLLIVANSARLLVESAQRGGYRIWAADRFGDSDTRSACERFLLLRKSDPSQELLSFARDACQYAGAVQLVYGGGFEHQITMLEQLGECLPIRGNSPDCLRRLQKPQPFFTLLRELAIPFPEISTKTPDHPGEWLCKPACGEGGIGIDFASQKSVSPNMGYYQRYYDGRTSSLLFLANGRSAQAIGYNTLWQKKPFRFAGAINRTCLTSEQRQQVACYSSRLTQALALQGLHSLDFVLDAERTCRVLELNARPSASLALYDEDYAAGLLTAHVVACTTKTMTGPPTYSRNRTRAFRILYAPVTLRIPHTIKWPTWCKDRPLPNTEIEYDTPLCSIHADSGTCASVLRQLQQHQVHLLHRLYHDR